LAAILAALGGCLFDGMPIYSERKLGGKFLKFLARDLVQLKYFFSIWIGFEVNEVCDDKF
jgi:hypothetical protein